MTNYGLFTQLMKSMSFCVEATTYAVIIGLILCYLSVIPLLRPVCDFMRKFRFLPSTGLSFLFMKLTSDIEQQMMWMMVFGVSTFLIDSFISISLSIGPDDIAYCKSLRLSRWKMVRELLIFGKASEIFAAATQQFAMAWMLIAAIENIFKSNGGIGVVLAESNKYFRLDQVYAVEIIILLTGITVDYTLRQVKLWLFPWERLKIIK